MTAVARPEVVALAHARAAARDARDWPEADRLLAAIEAAGWKVVDRGTSFQLLPAHPPDLLEDGFVRYGRSDSVPSRLLEAATMEATIILVATDDVAALRATLSGLRRHAPVRSQVVLVADAPSDTVAASLLDSAGAAAGPIGGTPLELIWTSTRLGNAAAWNAGLRRSLGAVVILLDLGLEPVGDLVGPLVRALDDPSVAVAGARGLVSVDLRHFEPSADLDVDAIEGSCLAFRRADLSARGPLDERFLGGRLLDVWWSLVLRDEGEGQPPRRAVVVGGLPLAPAAAGGRVVGGDPQRSGAPEPTRTPERGGALTATDPAARDRESRRNGYRILDRFGRRPDLVAGRSSSANRSG